MPRIDRNKLSQYYSDEIVDQMVAKFSTSTQKINEEALQDIQLPFSILCSLAGTNLEKTKEENSKRGIYYSKDVQSIDIGTIDKCIVFYESYNPITYNSSAITTVNDVILKIRNSTEKTDDSFIKIFDEANSEYIKWTNKWGLSKVFFEWGKSYITCNIVYLKNNGFNLDIKSVYLGDNVTYFYNGSSIIPLSEQHIYSNENERDRVDKSGIWDQKEVTFDKTDTFVTRCFGKTSYQKNFKLNDFEAYKRHYGNITKEDYNQYLIDNSFENCVISTPEIKNINYYGNENVYIIMANKYLASYINDNNLLDVFKGFIKISVDINDLKLKTLKYLGKFLDSTDIKLAKLNIIKISNFQTILFDEHTVKQIEILKKIKTVKNEKQTTETKNLELYGEFIKNGKTVLDIIEKYVSVLSKQTKNQITFGESEKSEIIIDTIHGGITKTEINIINDAVFLNTNRTYLYYGTHIRDVLQNTSGIKKNEIIKYFETPINRTNMKFSSNVSMLIDTYFLSFGGKVPTYPLSKKEEYYRERISLLCLDAEFFSGR